MNPASNRRCLSLISPEILSACVGYTFLLALHLFWLQTDGTLPVLGFRQLPTIIAEVQPPGLGRFL
ncbi:hypothetical protein B0H12DRAFT_1120570 [Mycena haematopus]|nr:hypothetical protein B0H12DRAFT_1123494 [Mycena haematopus]KAJ7250485.1 hypothetical protein B0H12DRAFT_1120570 [Mycena haematopus]